MYNLKVISGSKLVFLESPEYGSEVFKPEVINGRLQLINIVKNRRCCVNTGNIEALEPKKKKSGISKCKFKKHNTDLRKHCPSTRNAVPLNIPSSKSTPESSIKEENQANESDNSMQCPSFDSGYQSERIRFTDISSILENANSVPDLTYMGCIVKKVNSTGNVLQDVISKTMSNYGCRWSLPSESVIKKNSEVLSCNVLQKTSSFDSGIQSQSGTFGSVSTLGVSSFENTSNSQFKAPSSISMELVEGESKNAHHSTPKFRKLVRLHRTPTKNTPKKVAKLVEFPGSTPKHSKVPAALNPPTVTKWRKCITPKKNYSRNGVAVDLKSNETKWMARITNKSEYFRNATMGVPAEPIYEVWTTKVIIDENTMISAKRFKEQLANCSESVRDSYCNRTKDNPQHGKLAATNLVRNPVKSKCLADSLRQAFQRKCKTRPEATEPRYLNLLDDISSSTEPAVLSQLGFE